MGRTEVSISSCYGVASAISPERSYMLSLIFGKMAESPDVLFNLCGMKPTVEIDLLHTRVSQKFKRIFNQGCVCKREKTLCANW